MTTDDAKILASGLLHDGIRADRLTDKARDQIRSAIDVLIRLAGHSLTSQNRSTTGE